MKIYLIFGLIIILIGCVKSSENVQILSKITSVDKNFSLEDFKNIGFNEKINF